jgi:hypothetical protein
VKPARQAAIRRALEAGVEALAETQAKGYAPSSRAQARALNRLEEHGARLRMPSPHVFAALRLPEEFAQSVTVGVPVPTTAGPFVLTVRVTLVYLPDSWSAATVGAEPLGDDPAAAEVLARAAALEADRRARGERAAEAAPPLPAAPAARAPGGAGGALLHPADPAAGRSRFGGVPFLPAGFDWPRRESGRALHFLLDLREVPPAPVLPESGVLAFFYDGGWIPSDDEPSGDDGFRVVFVAEGEDLVPVAPPADTLDEFVRPVAGVRFATGDEGQDLPCHRLLGAPDPIQDDPLEGGWELLLQVDSGAPLDFDFGDSGRIYFLMRPDDLAAQRWERARVLLQCY